VEGCEIVRGSDLGGIENHTAGPDLTVSVTAANGFYWTDSYTWVTDTQLGLWEQHYPLMDASTYRFDPPLIVLDMPLTTGKTWTSESVRQRWDGVSEPRTYILTSVVLGPLTVDTVVGPLDVVEVFQTNYLVGFGGRTDRRYLHEELGDVYELIEAANCGMVATQARTWSSVKSLYR